jgi:hypothetical protein
VRRLARSPEPLERASHVLAFPSDVPIRTYHPLNFPSGAPSETSRRLGGSFDSLARPAPALHRCFRPIAGSPSRLRGPSPPSPLPPCRTRSPASLRSGRARRPSGAVTAAASPRSARRHPPPEGEGIGMRARTALASEGAGTNARAPVRRTRVHGRGAPDAVRRAAPRLRRLTGPTRSRPRTSPDRWRRRCSRSRRRRS